MKPTTNTTIPDRATFVLVSVPNTKYTSDQLLNMIAAFKSDNNPVLVYFNGHSFGDVALVLSKLQMTSQGVMAYAKILPTMAAEHMRIMVPQCVINPVFTIDEKDNIFLHHVELVVA